MAVIVQEQNKRLRICIIRDGCEIPSTGGWSLSQKSDVCRPSSTDFCSEWTLPYCRSDLYNANTAFRSSQIAQDGAVSGLGTGTVIDTAALLGTLGPSNISPFMKTIIPAYNDQLNLHKAMGSYEVLLRWCVY